jgi:hypothetical protein
MILKDLELQKELIEKEKTHKSFVHTHEKKNIDYAVDRVVRFQQEIDIEKKKDAEHALKQAQDFQRELEEQKRQKFLRQQEFLKWQESMILEKHQKEIQKR